MRETTDNHKSPGHDDRGIYNSLRSERLGRTRNRRELIQDESGNGKRRDNDDQTDDGVSNHGLCVAFSDSPPRCPEESRIEQISQ